MKKKVFEKDFRALGTKINIRIIGESGEYTKSVADLFEAEGIYVKQQKIFSRFDKESELSFLNSNLGRFKKASDDMICLARECLKCYAETNGIFDPRILEYLENIGYKESFDLNDFKKEKEIFLEKSVSTPLENDLIIRESGEIKFNKRMDFTGLAKGYITDKVSQFLSSQGWNNFLVDSGGDMYAKGLNEEGLSWGIGLEGYKNEDEVIFEISNQGLATSGNTRKFWGLGEKKIHHLINPKDKNHFDFEIKTVTVLAENATRADLLAKFIFILGLEDGLRWANENEIPCVFLKSESEIIRSNF